MYWDLLLTCRVVELPIDIFLLWLRVAPVGCSGNLVYAYALLVLSKHIVMYSIKKKLRSTLAVPEGL